MKTSFGKQLVIVLVAGAILLTGIYLMKKGSATPAIVPVPVMTGNTADLVSFSILPGATVSGVVSVTGSLRGAYFFEANARGMLLDANKNVVKNFPLTAVGDWMTSDPVAFTATFDASGMTAGPGYIRLANDNPSGDAIRDKYIDIPVVFQ